jgi:hypothetical protein
MATTGKVIRVTSKPTMSFTVQPPGGPPAPEPVIFNSGVTLADLVVASSAKAGGSDVDVEGTPPACDGVTSK